MNPESVMGMYQRSGRVLLQNLDGLTPEQAFWTPAPNVNSINWLLGHIISARTGVTKVVRQQPVWDDGTRSRYWDGSAPVTGEGEGVIDLMRMLFDFAESQRRLEAGFASITASELEAPAEPPSQRFGTKGNYTLYLQAHEMQHVGHIMIVRELLGLPSYWS